MFRKMPRRLQSQILELLSRGDFDTAISLQNKWQKRQHRSSRDLFSSPLRERKRRWQTRAGY